MQKADLDKLYRESSPTAWTTVTGDRADWKLAKQRIESRFGSDPVVLDVGCFDGAFLASLATVRRFGIEISQVGMDRAKQRGVVILSEDYKRMDGRITDFDVITAFDVIEHVEDPRAFIRSIVGRLRDGGMLIISTGNLDAWTWRVARSRYWYCAIPEHISFLSRRWFEDIARILGLGVVEVVPFTHGNESLTVRLLEMATNALYLVAPGVARYLRAKGFGTLDATAQPEIRDFPPCWMSSRDHVLAVFEKPATGAMPGS
jgi:SAM-dependent methyltransferase